MFHRKRQLTLWLNESEDAALDRVAGREGVPRATALRGLLRAEALVVEREQEPTNVSPRAAKPRQEKPAAAPVQPEPKGESEEEVSLADLFGDDEPVVEPPKRPSVRAPMSDADFKKAWERSNPGKKWQG